jgi:hypothetical protein
LGPGAPRQRQSERKRKRTVVGEYRYMACHRFGEFVRRADQLNAAELAVAALTIVGCFFGWRRRLARSPPKPRSGDKRRGRIRGRPMAFNVAATVTRCFEVLAI